MSYKHFTTKERFLIEHYRKLEWPYRKIAKKLNRSHSSILREVKRNALENDLYNANYADIKYIVRREKAYVKNKSTEFLINYIREKILLTWSPEQISNRLKKDYPNDKTKHISTKKIYNLIYARKIPGISKKNLRKKGKGYKHSKSTVGKIKDAINISERPKEANDRTEIGHWELDTVRGNKESKKCLGTYDDRKSRYVIIAVLNNGTADEFNTATLVLFKTKSKGKLKTLTFDNGSEFSKHTHLKKKMKVSTYFANPHSPWQRPTNENNNGLIREFFPKKKSFENITQEEADKVADLINNRPRKCLNWKTAKEVFFENE